jgi:hypothetical protein
MPNALDILLMVLAAGAVVYAWFLFFVYPRMSEFREMSDAAERLGHLARLSSSAKSHRPEPKDVLAVSEGLRPLYPPNGHAGA